MRGTHRACRSNRVRICVSALLAASALLSPASAQPPANRPKAGDSSSVTAHPLPLFHQIPGWGEAGRVAQPQMDGAPLEYAIDRLCQFYGSVFDARTMIQCSRSPLEWPRVLARQFPDATRQRLEARALLEANALAFREIAPMDLRASALADSVATAVAHDHPVLFNSPDAALVYGYDRREPDHWWWVDRAVAPEIVLESERAARFTLWTDDPAAGVTWIVPGSTGNISPRSDSAQWEFLRTVTLSVAGRAEEGVQPYPLSLRDFREMLASADSLPALAEPVSSSDPLGVRKARAAREYLLRILEETEFKQKDSIVVESIRLSKYHLHTALASLDGIASALYGSSTSDNALDSLRSNWQAIKPRRVALDHMTEVLKAEKAALEELTRAVAQHDKLSAKQSTGARRRGR